MGSYQEEQVAEGLVATKYILGDEKVDGHTHVLYLRDDLPVATETSERHAHSIEKGPEDTVLCIAANGHTHSILVVEETGDYANRTL